jgi:hypothetical protein
MGWLRLAVILTGCGRLSFDSTSSVPDAARTDHDPAIDAPPGTTIVTFGETPGATYRMVTRDAFINSASMGHNYGSERFVALLATPLHTGLVGFDVSALPPETVIAGVTLHVSSPDVLAGDLEVYEVLEAWQEGTKTGGSGTSNWFYRDSGTLWSNAGAEPPGSRASIAIARATPAPAGAISLAFDAQGVALVQRWIDAPATNLGIALHVKAGAWSFASREALAAASRPLLEIAIR